MSRIRESAKLGPYRDRIETVLSDLKKNRVLSRLWRKDHTLWKPSPVEIADRLGWLQSPAAMRGEIPGINAFANTVQAAGYTHALLLGMGGSSLAPEVFRKTFGVSGGGLDLAVLDSTDPAAVLSAAGRSDPSRTLFIVSTKSGGTVETFSFFRYFYNLLNDRIGSRQAGDRFIAITDPGSALAELAQSRGFRAAFLNDPHIGGRYSALSFFGLVPAALIGLDIGTLLTRAVTIAEKERIGTEDPANVSDGLFLGAVLGEMARIGRDKATFFFPGPLESFGNWLEQLIAESTGKEGKGIVPLVGEPSGPSAAYGEDRLFLFFHLGKDGSDDGRAEALAAEGHPVLQIGLDDPYDLGGQCFLWEVATAFASHILGVNPFDQPDVEKAKILARNMIARYREEGALPEDPPAMTGGGISIFGETNADNLRDALRGFLAQAAPGSYVGLQAYLPPNPETDLALLKLRSAIRDRFHLASTAGYGPRFLHSTGQLHKGDGGRGVFIQLTAEDRTDMPIPDELGKPKSSMTFGILKAAQAAGDGEALRSAGRPVIRFHLGRDVKGGLETMLENCL
ncbi:MAG: glucose-6-phosphate isomerase [Deltaproteobacteria bacterium]|nr:glucose-6-phosphate isomerase [Deltaproteobacteria bacterium]